MNIQNLITLKAALISNGTFSTELQKELLKLLAAPIIEARNKARIKRNKLKRNSRELVAMLKDIDQNGFFCVQWFSRDCDCVEKTSFKTYTSIEAYHEEINEIGNWAEGPVYYTHVDVSNADNKSTTRDRILQAYENGNTSPYLV